MQSFTRLDIYDNLLSVDYIQNMDFWIKDWHETDKKMPRSTAGFIDVAQQLLYFNYALWHEEDQARRQDLSDRDIAQIKRNIDRFNQLRNDTIETFDQLLKSRLNGVEIQPTTGALWNSETPGSIIDRISILSLKIYHMHEETLRLDVGPGHIERALTRENILNEQRSDLGLCMDYLLMDLALGKKVLKLYYQFKMYNDPSTNPALYRAHKAI